MRESASDQLLWVAKVEASMAAANNGRTGNKDSINTKEATKDNDSLPTAKTASKPKEQDSKGSRTQRKERWK